MQTLYKILIKLNSNSNLILIQICINLFMNYYHSSSDFNTTVTWDKFISAQFHFYISRKIEAYIFQIFEKWEIFIWFDIYFWDFVLIKCWQNLLSLFLCIFLLSIWLQHSSDFSNFWHLLQDYSIYFIYQFSIFFFYRSNFRVLFWFLLIN
jgi:hypothetical protein